MSIFPNRLGLKAISGLAIDTHFIQIKNGDRVFSHQGESTPEYQELSLELSEIIDDILTEAQTIKAQIPVINKK